MKTGPHRDLLDELYPTPGAGPDCDIVLAMVRAHRTTRRIRKTAILALSCMLLAAIVLLRTPVQSPPTSTAKAAPAHVPRINDEELLDLIGSQSAAIATLPDGSQRLLVVVHEGWPQPK
jgi:hypothetical protein